ncbi:MAG: glycosyltransferase family 4 protein [Gemmatimonadota bacterium]
MNIWWVNQVALPPTEPGVTRHYDFARELIDRGHEVTVILSNFHYIRRQEIKDLGGARTEFEEIEGVPFLWIKTPSYGKGYARRVWSWVIFAWRLWRGQGAEHLPPPQLIIGSSPYPFAALAAQKVARRRNIPFVLEVRDLWPQTLIELGGISRWHPFIILLDRIERFLYRRADAIVSLLPHAGPYMEGKGADSSRINWIPNGVKLDLIPFAEPEPCRDTFTFIYAGGHGLPNELDDLLDAAALLKQTEWAGRIRLRLVGDGPEKPRLMRRAELEHLDNVSFGDSVPKSEIYRVLKEADAFVVAVRASPLYKYGVSLNKFFDYLAMGRPTVIASAIEPNPFATAGAGAVAYPGDPDSIVRALIEIASLPAAQRREMGLAGREYVRAHHDLPSLVARLEEVLQQASRMPA